MKKKDIKKYFKEIIILVIQLLVFYLLPLFAGPTDTMGLVVLTILITLLLSIILSIISKEKIKHLYPIIITLLYISSVFIYNNGLSLIHSIWYLIISSIGLLIGLIVNKVLNIKK